MKKCIVVGAGILGASTAYHLAKKGVETVIVDRKDIGQATDAAAGIVCPWVSQRRNKAWYKLASSGARYYPELIDKLRLDGETDTGYAKVGAVSLHTSPEKLAAMEERAAVRRENAPEIGPLDKLSKEETKEAFPPLSSGYISLKIGGAARVDGRALRDSLLSAAKKTGAVMVEGDAALAFENQQVHGVKVNDELLTADTVIVCAGAWASDVIRPLGLNFQVSFQKAQIVHLGVQEDTSSWPVVMPQTDQYLLAFDDQRVVAGATHENMEQFDTRLTAAGIQEVLGKALDTAPGLADSTFLEARTGFRPFTPGFLPVIGPLPGFQGILVANGLGASGLTMGPYIGSELAKLALGENLEIDLALYPVAGALG